MIEKNIFQTYKTPYKDLSDSAKKLTLTWQEKNPDYNYIYFSDKDIEKFIVKHYGKVWQRRYEELPFPVMKSDVFRILALNIYGGFYADLDTICRKPLDQINYKGIDSVISVYEYYEFTHWFFGFKKDHGILNQLVESLGYNLDNLTFKDFDDPKFCVYQSHAKEYMELFDSEQNIRYICNVTGPWWFSAQVHKYFDLGDPTKIDYSWIPRGHIDSGLYQSLKEKNSLWLDRAETDDVDDGMVRHIFGSRDNFYGDGYTSWNNLY